MWVRDEKIENILEGRRQGAALPKNKSLPLAPSSRSKLCKIDFFNLAIQSASVLSPPGITDSLENTYYQAKNDRTDEGIAMYRRSKHQLCGSVNATEQDMMVKRFLEATRGNSGTDSEEKSIQQKTLQPFPFHGWLVSGEDFESFHSHGQHRPRLL